MFIQKYQTCNCCGQILPRNREFFKRDASKEHESYHITCKACEEKKLIDENWKDGKLKCHICGEWLDPNQFQKHQFYSYRDHRDTRCSCCKAKQNLQARQNYSEDRRLSAILQERWYGAKLRANTKNIPFNITKEDLKYLWDEQKGLCALSGIPMTYELDNGRIYTNVSVDQILPNKGYTIDNIQLVCMGINQMKSDLDMSTLLFLCKSLLDKQTHEN